MSWKGLTKAVARLPQMVMSKAGYSESTQDPEFKEIEDRFTALDVNARKLHDDAKKFKDSLTLMLAHQESFAVTLKEVYEPITSDSVLPELMRRNSQSGTLPSAAERHGNRTSPNTSTKSIPKATPQEALRAAEEFARFSQQAKDSLTPDLEVIERRLVAPTKDLVQLLDNVKKMIVKRGHKLLDYDRHRESVKKMQAKTDRTAADEKTLGKYEVAFDQASRDYNHINSLLKQQIPVLLTLKASFIDPCFQTLYWYQLRVHTTLVQGFRVLINQPVFDRSVSVALGFEAKAEQQSALLQDLTILAKNRKTLSPSVQAIGAPDTYSSPITSPASPPAYSNSTSNSFNQANGFGAMHKTAAPPDSSTRGWDAPATSPISPTKKYVVALYDYDAQADGDLSFKRDERIEIIERSDNPNDWWTGRLRGVTGVFPGNYVAEV